MKYLLCYASMHMNMMEIIDDQLSFKPNQMQSDSYTKPEFRKVHTSLEESHPGVKTEEYEDFKEAITQYTYRCLYCEEVTLSEFNDIGGHILRQYSRKNSNNNRVFIC